MKKHYIFGSLKQVTIGVQIHKNIYDWMQINPNICIQSITLMPWVDSKLTDCFMATITYCEV